MTRILLCALLSVVFACGGKDPELGTVCRAADPSNPCDVDDVFAFDEQTRLKTCAPTGGNAKTVCRPSAGVCDPAEECDGKSEACPTDSLFNSTVICATGSRCTSTARCSGTRAGCDTVSNLPSGTPCRDATTDCDLADVCDASGNCPDRVQPAGKACMAALCSGPSVCQPMMTMNRCCTRTAGICSSTGTCPAASCSCFCTTQPC